MSGRRVQLQSLLIITLTLCSSIRVSEAQWQNALNSLLESLTNANKPKAPQCTPFKLPEGFDNYQQYCKSLSYGNDTYWDQLYRNSPPPSSATEVFPLKGCVLGCIIGKDAYTRGLRWGAGAWSGKCFRNTADVVNLLSPLPPFGGMLTALDTFNWSSFLPVMEQFPGKLSQGPSWFDAASLLRGGGRINNAWIITYDDVQVPEANPNNTNPLSGTQRTYAQLVKNTRDEMRLVAPNMLVGQVYQRPQTTINPLPIGVNAGIRFALFQTCDASGNYATGGNRRKLG